MDTPRSEDGQASDVNYAGLIHALGIEEKALLKVSSTLSSATDLNRELQALLQRNQGKRPAFLPGVSRKRVEELELEFAAQQGQVAEPLYEPKFRPCACGCGAMVIGEAGCEGGLDPIQRRNLNETERSPERQAILARTQKASCERLHHRQPKAEPAPPVVSIRSRPLDRARLEEIARPREPAEPPEPYVPLPARPAPPDRPPKIVPRLMRRSKFEALPRRTDESRGSGTEEGPLQHMVSSRPTRIQRSLKLTPSKRDLPGLAQLLNHASVADAAPSESSQDWSMPRRVESVRTKKSQDSYVKAHLYPKTASIKPGSAADLEIRLEQARQQRMALERELREGCVFI
eukprot:TRINITY_DN34005_c0_g1_i1.p1 TRINITY_DN34005_c0_g1~~TRINITY_DN34005_c0_g1_i1.p1  ORF type:complete len:346 (+),score=46.40 TRINITY_DN34005_c0_g1_i1:69-1106(+)